jgi:alpha-N-arabinofuranosidase
MYDVSRVAHNPPMSLSGSYLNPILPGFYPDPSICRVGEDFYLANSSFAYFPGIPISHSRDLVHWEQIGSALDRRSQLPLEGAGISRGLFAPTLRQHEGRFYLVCTNVDHGGNFIVTALDPAGPWSEPTWLRNAPGIDPSLFFDVPDEAGRTRCWYCGTRPAPEGERYSGNWEIWLQELDLGSLELKGEARGIWRGALRDCIWPEGPHIYRRGGWYYLLIAEGGTGQDHAISVARSRSLEGPWLGKPANPILTHRHFGLDYPVVNVGHGDLVEDGGGDWWMVHLASRQCGGRFHNLGRETFLVPVAWEEDWPLPSPGSGRAEESYPLPRLPRFEPESRPARDNFEHSSLAFEWLALRAPASSFSSFDERPGYLRLRLLPATLRDRAAVSYLGRRQRDLSFKASCSLDFVPSREGEAAGLALVQSEDNQYRLELGLWGGERLLRLVVADGSVSKGGADRVVAERPFPGAHVILEVEARGQSLSFSFGASPAGLELLASGLDGRVLSTERAGGFVGTTLGMYATGNGTPSANFADFDWFEYRELL